MLDGLLLPSNMAAKLLFASDQLCCKRYYIIFSTFSLKLKCKICVQKEVLHNFKNHILVAWPVTNSAQFKENSTGLKNQRYNSDRIQWARLAKMPAFSNPKSSLQLGSIMILCVPSNLNFGLRSVKSRSLHGIVCWKRFSALPPPLVAVTTYQALLHIFVKAVADSSHNLVCHDATTDMQRG